MQMSAACLICIPSVEFSFPSRQFAASICLSSEFLRLPIRFFIFIFIFYFFTVFLGKSGNSCIPPDAGFNVTDKDNGLTSTVNNLDQQTSCFSLA